MRSATPSGVAGSPSPRCPAPRPGFERPSGQQDSESASSSAGFAGAILLEEGSEGSVEAPSDYLANHFPPEGRGPALVQEGLDLAAEKLAQAQVIEVASPTG